VGEFGFDFTRFGVRIPALLVSPRIAPGTVFRAKAGTLDHTSVLKTLGLRWNLKPLTARDAAAPDLGDALTLKSARKDDPLKGVRVPVTSPNHPRRLQPSKLEKIHAERLSQLPIRNDQGTYDHSPPDLKSTAALGDYIRGRSAVWSQHVERHKRM
jgi:phospholipase C